MNEETSFPSLIKNYFGFLLTEYNFTMQEGTGVFGKTIVYQSLRLIVQICEDRGSIFVFLKPVGEPEIAQLELLNILEALSVVIPQDLQGPLAPAQYDRALAYYASSLKLHCDKLLRGDLSGWVGFLEFALNRMKSEYSLRTKGKQLPKRVYQELEGYISSKSPN